MHQGLQGIKQQRTTVESEGGGGEGGGGSSSRLDPGEERREGRGERGGGKVEEATGVSQKRVQSANVFFAPLITAFEQTPHIATSPFPPD